jgi:sigma-B regulation protein RsbU (phosphoserine phosphatase)
MKPQTVMKTMAVGTQIGTAMHNASLVRAAMERQQLEREMRLAHDLQLKLLPRPSVVLPEARAAARVVPAESVGGDFFLLARLDRDRTGVLIGDVSGHGYQAALVMALALSAAAIHVQAAFDPSCRGSRAASLATTSRGNVTHPKYAVITVCGEVRFATRTSACISRGSDGDCTRPRHAPDRIHRRPSTSVMSWRPGDRLVLFTDGS